MAPIVSTVEINRPPELVFAYVTDPATFSEWQANVIRSGPVGDGAQRIGSRCTSTRLLGGRERTTTQEITELSPPRRWAVRGIDGPVRADVDVDVVPLDGDARSRVTISLDLIGKGAGRLLVPVIRSDAAKEVAASCQKLKEVLEAGADDEPRAP